MKKIVILFFAVLAQAVYVFGEGLVRELERDCAKGGLTILPDASRARIKAAFERRIAEIRATPNMAVPVGAERRYLSESGSDAADGKTPATAWRTTARLEKENLVPGSFVLFERGGVYRGGFRASKGTGYLYLYSAKNPGERFKSIASSPPPSVRDTPATFSQWSHYLRCDAAKQQRRPRCVRSLSGVRPERSMGNG